MIKIYNFDSCELSGYDYGGHGGSKKGIIFQNDKWFLKYPKSTKSMSRVNISYTTMPLSEYLGSQIYQSIGINTHETVLGIANNRLVVACRDFLKDTEVIVDYNAIKNRYNEEQEEKMENIKTSTTDANTDIEEVLLVMEHNSYFLENPELKKHFWDMFVMDAFIGNNDRNEGNWGMIFDKKSRQLRISPVFDNGASFNNKSDADKLREIIENPKKFQQSVYESSTCAFYKDGKVMNPLKYMQSMENKDLNAAILRIVPCIKMDEIAKLFGSIPAIFEDIEVMNSYQKKFYYHSLAYKYNTILYPLYIKLKTKTNE